MKNLFLLLIPFLISSCSYSIVEEIQFHQNKTADLKLSMDFAQSLNSKNKDMIIQMVSGGAKMMAQNLSGKKGLNSDNSLTKNVDKLFSQAKDSLKPVLFEMAFDTIKKLNRDSIFIALTKKDSLNKYTPKQLALESNLAYYLLRNAKVRMQMNVPQNIMKFEVELNNISWDSLSYYKLDAFKKGGELAKIDEKNAMIADLFPQWIGNEITRSANNFNVIHLAEGQPLDDKTKQAWEGSYFIIKYHLPAKGISCSNKSFKASGDGLTYTLKETFLSLFNTKTPVSTVIKY